MDNVDVMGEVDVITAEQVTEQDQADREARLIPEGTWESQVVSWTKQEESEKGETSPYKGVPIYRVGICHYDCPEAGKKKVQFYTMTPAKLLNEAGKPKAAYTSMVGLVKTMQMMGQPIPEVLEQAKVARFKVRVGQFTPADGSPVNFLRGISGV